VTKRELETAYACAEALQYVARVLGSGGQPQRGHPAARHRYRLGRGQKIKQAMRQIKILHRCSSSSL